MKKINNFKNSIFYIPKKQSNKEQFIINWSHTNLKINRFSKFNYVDFITEILYNNGTGKICGVDSKNNSLYFPENEECPINYISITKTKNDINGNIFKTLTTLSLNNGQYLHYTNENINGKIYVQTTIKGEKKHCENKVNEIKDDICVFLDNCLTEKGFINIEDSYLEDKYEKIDNDNLGDFIENNNLNSLNNKYYSKEDEVYFEIREWIGINNKTKDKFYSRHHDLIDYYEAPSIFSPKLPSLIFKIFENFFSTIIFLLNFIHCPEKCIKCCRKAILYILASLVIIVDLVFGILKVRKIFFKKSSLSFN